MMTGWRSLNLNLLLKMKSTLIMMKSKLKKSRTLLKLIRRRTMKMTIWSLKPLTMTWQTSRMKFYKRRNCLRKNLILWKITMRLRVEDLISLLQNNLNKDSGWNSQRIFENEEIDTSLRRRLWLTHQLISLKISLCQLLRI